MKILKTAKMNMFNRSMPNIKIKEEVQSDYSSDSENESFDLRNVLSEKLNKSIKTEPEKRSEKLNTSIKTEQEKCSEKLNKSIKTEQEKRPERKVHVLKRKYGDDSSVTFKKKYKEDNSFAFKRKYEDDTLPVIKHKYEDNSISLYTRRRSVPAYPSYFLPTLPMYRQYQLLGDSQLVRFSQQLLTYNNNYVSFTEDTHSRRIGYCVSGQKIKDLLKRLEAEEFPLHDNVIMLIGTNDLINHSNLNDMCDDYMEILNILKQKCKKLVLLTVPPVPRLAKNSKKWNIMKSFNKFVESIKDDKQIFVLDFCSLFVSYDNSISKEYFESHFYGGLRPDLIHLNRKGFLLLKTILNIFIDSNKNDLV